MLIQPYILAITLIIFLTLGNHNYDIIYIYTFFNTYVNCNKSNKYESRDPIQPKPLINSTYLKLMKELRFSIFSDFLKESSEIALHAKVVTKAFIIDRTRCSYVRRNDTIYQV